MNSTMKHYLSSNILLFHFSALTSGELTNVRKESSLFAVIRISGNIARSPATAVTSQTSNHLKRLEFDLLSFK